MSENEDIATDIFDDDLLELIKDDETQESQETDESQEEAEAVPEATEGVEQEDSTNPDEATEETEEEPQEELDVDVLAEYLETGKKLREYEKAHPGFDPVKLHGEFTRKSQELAQVKKELEELKTSKVEAEPVVDISDIDAATLGLLDRYAKAKGFVSKQEMQSREQRKQQQQYEDIKKQQINTFLDKYPEYKPEHEKGDENWQTLLGELNSWYKLPSNPKEIGDLLERIHTSISPSPSFNAKKVAKIIAQKKVNKVGQSASGGSAASTQKKSAMPLERAKKLFKGYSDSELEELFVSE